MNPPAQSCIAQRPHYLRVDFGACDVHELTRVYQRFADLCIGSNVNRALLNAGDNEPNGHEQLREILSAVIRTAAIAPDFKLALVPSTPAIAAIYTEAQQAFRALGLNAWAFGTVAEAMAWLEDRAPCGPMVS